MSRAPREAAGPAPLTDEEVAALAGERRPRALTRRIADHSPAEATGRLDDDKAAPPTISRAEMEKIRRSGRVGAALRARLAAAVDEASDRRSRPRRRKDAPTAAPPD